MDIAKCRWMVTFAALAGTPLMAVAQAPAANTRAAIRPPATQPQGLSNPALKLTDAQKAQIEKIMAAYRDEETALRKQATPSQQIPAAERAPIDEQAVRQKIAAERGKESGPAAARQSRARMSAAVDQVLNDSQRKILHESEAARSVPPVMANPRQDGKLPAR